MGRNGIRETEKRSERREMKKDDRRGRGWEAVGQEWGGERGRIKRNKAKLPWAFNIYQSLYWVFYLLYFN